MNNDRVYPNNQHIYREEIGRKFLLLTTDGDHEYVDEVYVTHRPAYDLIRERANRIAHDLVEYAREVEAAHGRYHPSK